MRTLGTLLLLVGLLPTSGSAQGRPELRVERSNGGFTGVPVALDEGFAAVPLTLLDDLGWVVDAEGNSISISVPGEIRIAMRIGSPFFRWDGVVLQMTNGPYDDDGDVFVPLQILTDFFPRRLPDLYDFDGTISTLRAADPEVLRRVGARGVGGAEVAEPHAVEPEDDPDPTPEDVLPDAAQLVTEPDEAPQLPPEGPSSYEGVRVVVIDAGHGGADPGAMGPDGIREKSVALGIALALEGFLADEPGLEVYMTRDDDTFVDIWDRGENATEIKGDRPGIFVSIHANSFPARRAATGFETYFLSEARTEHERRVAAIENAPLSFQGQNVDPEEQPDLGFILRELRNLDHQHWSALLAELVQDELNDFHPGPNRGVKQGVLAVLTNALMPSVLVEVGYLSNETEGRLLGEDDFQRNAAEAIAGAVVRFFERYPPGSGFGG